MKGIPDKTVFCVVNNTFYSNGFRNMTTVKGLIPYITLYITMNTTSQHSDNARTVFVDVLIRVIIKLLPLHVSWYVLIMHDQIHCKYSLAHANSYRADQNRQYRPNQNKTETRHHEMAYGIPTPFILLTRIYSQVYSEDVSMS